MLPNRPALLVPWCGASLQWLFIDADTDSKCGKHILTLLYYNFKSTEEYLQNWTHGFACHITATSYSPAVGTTALIPRSLFSFPVYLKTLLSNEDENTPKWPFQRIKYNWRCGAAQRDCSYSFNSKSTRLCFPPLFRLSHRYAYIWLTLPKPSFKGRPVGMSRLGLCASQILITPRQPRVGHLWHPGISITAPL